MLKINFKSFIFLFLILCNSVIDGCICFHPQCTKMSFAPKQTNKYRACFKALPSQNLERISLPAMPTIMNDDEFQSWLTRELADAPGRQDYKTTFENAIVAIIKWRQRYHGNPSLWKRIFKKERVIKELIESAPILDSVQTYVKHYNNENEEKITILDLCSGKGYLSMFLSEILPPEKISKIILIDKAWPMCNAEVLPHHMNWDHIYGNRTLQQQEEYDQDSLSNENNPTYFTTWPIPLHTSKQNLKQSCNTRQMKKYIFDRTEGPILILAVHLCGTLSLKAIDLFNEHDNVKFFCLKPCCLPGMAYAKRNDIFKIGRHSFPAEEVCSNGSFNKKNWSGPPRWHLEKKFEEWSNHLYKGIDIAIKDSNEYNNSDEGESHLGRKEKRDIQVQVDGGFQNTYLVAERSPLTNELWD